MNRFLVTCLLLSPAIAQESSYVQLSCGIERAEIQPPPGPIGPKGDKGEAGDSCEEFSKQRCPQTKFDFPSSGQTTDLIRVKTPIPNMAEFSICTWINPHSLGTTSRSIMSYATRSENNEFLLEVSVDRVGLLLNGANGQASISISGRTHLCATASPVSGWSRIYINARQVSRLSYSRTGIIDGGGSLLIGQEQDEFFGRLDPNQALAAVVENTMMWRRALTSTEIDQLYRDPCSCPEGHIMALTTDQIQISGKVAAFSSSQC